MKNFIVFLAFTRNAQGITRATGAGFLFVFKAFRQAHSRLRNCWNNTEDGQKDKSVVLVISCMFLSTTLINTAQAEGDIEMGRELSTQCSACHGTHGLSNSEQFPNIAGQKEAYLISQLEQYKSGERSDATMTAIVGPLDIQKIKDLAAYFSSNSPVASYSFETETLSIPYADVGDTTYKVEMLLVSPDDRSFIVDSLEPR